MQSFDLPGKAPGRPPAGPPAIAHALTIAGVDPSGGAGILADLKAFSALGAYGCAVVAALTAQNTRAVTGIHLPPTDFVRQQLDTLFDDVRIDAAKVGMLGSAAVTRTVADALARRPAPWLVVDPVMIAKSGDALLAPDAASMLREALIPLAHVITPNLPEAAALADTGHPESVRDMYRVAEKLRRLLPDDARRYVLLKGGHLPGDELMDLLFDGDQMLELPGQRVATKNTHGTGCTYSAAIAALLPQRGGVALAVREAHAWLARAIAAADRLDIATKPDGHGPVHHFHAWWR